MDAAAETVEALVQRVLALPSSLAGRIGAMAVRLRAAAGLLWRCWPALSAPAAPCRQSARSLHSEPSCRAGGSEPDQLLQPVSCRRPRGGANCLPRIPAGPHPAGSGAGGAALRAARPCGAAVAAGRSGGLPTLAAAAARPARVRIADGGKGSKVSEEELALLLQLVAARPEVAANLRHLGVRTDPRAGRHFEAGEPQLTCPRARLHAQPAAPCTHCPCQSREHSAPSPVCFCAGLLPLSLLPRLRTLELHWFGSADLAGVPASVCSVFLLLPAADGYVCAELRLGATAAAGVAARQLAAACQKARAPQLVNGVSPWGWGCEEEWQPLASLYSHKTALFAASRVSAPP